LPFSTRWGARRGYDAEEKVAVYVFGPLSNMAFLMLLRRMGRNDLTALGFHSTFRDWAAERTNCPREAAQMALAHAMPSTIAAATCSTGVGE
jgi:integrase